MREALAAQLADYKVPTHIRIVDSLPRDDSGKVYKRQLQITYRECGSHSRQSNTGVQTGIR
ncbi:hypothetical protein [Nocardia concava]|uniref:hypothetical protein n=1 Tax=Nocardia concava TaxID=257281 RepID=UPI0002DD3D3C|nr:hypothetical protein [Nocardia concava]